MRSSPGKGSSMEQCQESCQTTKGCQAFTIFGSGWCSHYSTLCTKTKWTRHANTYRLSTAYTWTKKSDAYRWGTASDTTTTVLATLEQETRTWIKLGFNRECDTSAGEKNMRSSSGKGSSLEQCKQSCQTTKGCQAFTIFKSGWCSHYSTFCIKTKWNGNANTYRWGISSNTRTTVETAVPVGEFEL